MNEAIRAAQEALDEQDQENAEKCMAYFRKYALLADSLLEGHPTWRLSRWISFARSHGTSPEEKDEYEKNARRLVTRWGPPIDDYAARIWSGLIRDYYLPRWEHFMQSRLSGKNPDMGAWEEKWVRSTGVSAAHAPEDLLQAPPPGRPGGAPSSFFPEKKRRINYRNLDVRDGSRRMELPGWPVSSADLEKLRGVRFIFTSGNHALEIEGVELLENGKVIARDQHAGLAGKSLPMEISISFPFPRGLMPTTDAPSEPGSAPWEENLPMGNWNWLKNEQLQSHLLTAYSSLIPCLLR